MRVLWPLFAALFGAGAFITLAMGLVNKQPVEDDDIHGGSV